MRQTISVLLLFSVLVSSTGFTLTKHFCGGELAHLAVGNKVKPCCGDKEEQDMPDDCCHDELAQALLDNSQLDYQTLQLQPLTFFTLSVLTHFLSFSPAANVPVSPWKVFHSPPLPDIAVYLRVQSFLI